MVIASRFVYMYMYVHVCMYEMLTQCYVFHLVQGILPISVQRFMCALTTIGMAMTLLMLGLSAGSS